MPIYAFVCDHCGHQFDRLQKLSDPDPTTCPDCGQASVRKQLTAPQFRLAGGGWYETDFKNDGDKKRNLVDKSDGAPKTDSAAAGSSESKSDSKPATGDTAAKPAAKPDPAPSKPADSKPASST